MRQRHGDEVPTPPDVVKHMVDNLEPIELDKTFLEPACWAAPFACEVLRRKLKLCKNDTDILTAYKTIYGTDLRADNLDEGKANMISLCPEERLKNQVTEIVNRNFFLMDFLTKKHPQTGEFVKIYDWDKGEWVYFKDIGEGQVSFT